MHYIVIIQTWVSAVLYRRTCTYTDLELKEVSVVYTYIHIIDLGLGG